MNKLSFWGRVRRLRYPATNSGRKKYIQDSLKKDPSRLRNLITYILLLFFSITGLAIVLVWIIKANYISSLGMLGVYGISAILMMGIFTGINGIFFYSKP